MSKYAPLGDFLRRQKTTFVPMTFAEIEKVVGTRLPNSQRYPAWWSNNPFNNVMTQVWLDAGFVTEQVDVASRKLVFRRARPRSSSADEGHSLPNHNDGDSAAGPGGEPQAHPIVGCMKGTVRIPEGVDLTAPADPDWGASLEQ
ncbi:MAG TPA: hypothetical protein VHR44_00725 [Beijerinckiaceae bacterium]|jgi:hypothetical protein|nr:hypothetical protein [Beijerinckiaceae bacterium]